MNDTLTTLITGAARGLGLSLTRHHLQRGDHVIALQRKESAALQSLAREESRLRLITADVGDGQSLRRAFSGLENQVERLDILYNNAGIFYADDKVSLAGTKIDRLQELYNVNAIGPLRVSQLALPLLGEKSVIVNVSSEAASFALCWRKEEYGYAMSKAALNMGSLILSRDLAAKGIRVIAVHPGWIHTDMGGPQAPDDPDQSAKNLCGMALQARDKPLEPIFRGPDAEAMPW